jgi:hypothetical protein
MNAPGALLLLAMVLAGPGAMAADADCGAGLDARQRRVVSSPRHQVVFVAQPAPMAVGRHFSLDIVVCARTPARRCRWPCGSTPTCRRTAMA